MAKILEFRDIPLEDLVLGKWQVRVSAVAKEIDELANSIDKVGLLEPILVAPTQNVGKFEIILGQRRFLAHQELGRKTITAGILDEHLDEMKAKVLSVTENLVRRDLSRKDLIDVCTYLYKRYDSMKDVARETGLPYNKVRELVKYDRLNPELKKLVDNNPKVKVKTALRAQDAMAADGDGNPEEAVKLAERMSGMSGTQQEEILQNIEEDSSKSVDEVVEQVVTRKRIEPVSITLGEQAYASLGRYAEDEGTELVDAAALLIEEGLINKGYEDVGDLE